MAGAQAGNYGGETIVAITTLRDELRAAVDQLTRSIVAKLLHGPTVAVKDAAGSSRGERLADSLRELFTLDDERDDDRH